MVELLDLRVFLIEFTVTYLLPQSLETQETLEDSYQLSDGEINCIIIMRLGLTYYYCSANFARR